jgi:hypothetical protein
MPSQGGPIMLFADLHEASPLLGELTDNKVDDLLKAWKDVRRDYILR